MRLMVRSVMSRTRETTPQGGWSNATMKLSGYTPVADKAVLNRVELSVIEVELLVPHAGSTAAEIGAVTESQKLISVSIVSSASIIRARARDAHRGVRGDSFRREVLQRGTQTSPSARAKAMMCSVPSSNSLRSTLCG